MKKINTFMEYSNINEQLGLLSVPLTSVDFGSGDDEKQIKLSAKDPKSNKVLILKYKISAKYSGIGFDVNLRNIDRLRDGSLYCEAQPDSWIGKKAVKNLIPKKNQTSDNWIMISVPKAKIEKAINDLRTAKGTKASIDAGQGVTINLELADD